MRFQIAIYLSILVGIVLHFVSRMRDSHTKNEVFQWKDNLLFSFYVLIVTVATATFRFEISEFLGHIKIGGFDIVVKQVINNYLFWVLIGFSGDVIWKELENVSQVILKSKDAPVIKEIPLPPV